MLSHTFSGTLKWGITLSVWQSKPRTKLSNLVQTSMAYLLYTLLAFSALFKQIKHIKMNELNDWQTEITIDALNHYWHYVVEKLSRTDLGDIERKNLELDKQRTHSTLMHLGAFLS